MDEEERLDSLLRDSAETALTASDEIDWHSNEVSAAADSLLKDSVFDERSIVLEDSLIRALDEDPYDTISVHLETEDTINLVMGKDGNLGVETDPIFNASAAKNITTSDISNWNSFGSYANLTGKPQINSVTLTGNKTAEDLSLQAKLVSGQNIKTINNQSILGSGNITIQGGGSGVTDYEDLTNKPQINNIELTGNKTLSDLGIATDTSDLTNGAGFITKTVSNLDNYTPSASLGDLAFEDTVDYDTQVINKPTIPTQTSQLTNNSGYITKSVNNLDNYMTTANINTALAQKLSSADVINNVTSTATNKPLSANMGKELQDKINNLMARGRFLSLWNAVTGLPTSNPTESPYYYKTGDYFIVGEVDSSINYKPNGSSYTIGVPSVTVEPNTVAVDDAYYYDGENWRLQANTQKSLSFANITGQPTDNSNLAAALNSKQNTISDLTAIRTGATAGATAVQPDDLATVATTGSYNDLKDIPSSSVVNDGTLTIQKNGTTINTFSANSSEDKTINISVPTNTNQLTNGSGFITASYHDNTKLDKNTAITGATKTKITYDTNGLVTNGADLVAADIPDLSGIYYLNTNPSGYITSAYHDNSKQDNLSTQTAYTSKGTSTKVPQITTNSLGQVTSISEVNIDYPSGPSAGTTASAVGTTSSGGSAATYSKSDHVHNITGATVSNALGYTPYNGTTNPNGYITSSSSITGNAATATKLATARTINVSDADSTNTGTGISFDGSSNGTIKLPSTIKATLTGNASSATKLATARTINGVSFDGTANITVKDSTKMGAVSANGYYGMAKPDGTTNDWIRTSQNGIIPYQSGGIGAGHQGLGTSTWYFSNAYVDNVHSQKTYITESSYLSYNSTDKCIEFNFN